jgi:Fe-Mn family superoxide dismutase
MTPTVFEPQEIAMQYRLAPLFCRPWTWMGITPRLIESHYEGNYGSALRRLNAITQELHAKPVGLTIEEADARIEADYRTNLY